MEAGVEGGGGGAKVTETSRQRATVGTQVALWLFSGFRAKTPTCSDSDTVRHDIQTQDPASQLKTGVA